jgi:hypothetical protein
MDPQKSSTETTNGADRRRSERVLLKVPVLLSLTSRDGLVTEERTCTQVVNAHGGLLELEMEISVGQDFLLTNSKTGVSRECTVVRTEQSLTTRGLLIAFQFATPSPDFWPIVFPPRDWQAVPEVVTKEK